MADIEFGEMEGDAAPRGIGGKFQSVINWAGALTSVGLVLGLAYWGYSLAVRDVTGVPVVRALEGPMRVAPENPGGRPADHQGLAVNSVAAAGEAEGPVERLVLAPKPVVLAEEDLPVAAVPEIIPSPDPVEQAAPDPEDDVAQAETIAPPAPLSATDALIAELVKGSAPIEAMAAENTPDAARAAPAAKVKADGPKILPVSVPGVSRSPRPSGRPASLNTKVAAAVAAPAAAAAAPEGIEVAATAIAPGTNLVQLGAYDSADVARTEWQRLSSRFGTLLEGKQRLVQSAKSGGRTFYRLRAVGFADISEARRFCAALNAEKAECIPVVSR